MKKTKRILSVLLTLLILFGTVSATLVFASAKEGKYGSLYYEINNDEVTITGCDNDYSGELILPDSIEGYPVTCIDIFAFHGCKNITGIALSANIKDFSEYTFQNCSGLKRIEVDKNNKSYSSDSFGVLFNKDKTNLIRCPIEIEITDYIIPDSVISILGDAFRFCKNIKTVLINQNTETILGNVFADCSKLTSINVDVNNKFYSSYEGVLFDNEKNKLIAYPIGNSRTSYKIIDGVKELLDDSFHNCSKLISITIPDSVTSIGNYAFEGCTGLTSVTIPDSVISIGNFVFESCTNLNSIVGANNITNIGYNPFQETEYYNNEKNWENGVLYIGKCILEAKQTLSGDFTIKNGTKAIANGAFAGKNITTVSMPDSVINIGSEAFIYCRNLTSINIPKNVKSIGGKAFYECSSLSNVVIENGVINIEDYAFSSTNIDSLTIPDSVINIGESAFDYAGVKSVIIGNNVENIGFGAFWGCEMTSIEIPASVKTIGEVAFGNCNNLTDISVDKENESYCNDNYGALYTKDNSRLIQYPVANQRKSYNISDKCKIIERNAFSDNTSLNTITIPNSVDEIGNNSFSGCSSLTSIIIPNSVKKIGERSFFECKNLNNVEILNGVETIDWECFNACLSLKSVTIPKSVNNIGTNAFGFDSSWNANKIPNFKIYCYKNTAGEKYAIENGFDYELLNDELETYAVTYNANGGSGAPAAQTKTHDVALTLSSTVPTRNGYTFKGWATSANGSAQYQPGATYTANASTTLYAVWAPVTYTISYNANGGSGAPAAQTKTHDVALTLSSTVPVREGYTFKGWSKSASGAVQYQPKAQYTANAAVTLYAVWAPISYTVRFYDGATLLGSKTLRYDESGTLSYGATPAKDGFKFTGWSSISGGPATLRDGQEIKNLSSTDSAVINYYAAWKAVESKTVTDSNTGVSVTAPEDAYNGDMTLKVEKVLSGSSFDILETVDDVVEKSEVFTIETYVNGIKTQPNGYVTVKIPVPSGFDESRCQLYYLNTTTQKAEPISFTTEGKFIIFKTNHFSDWAIVQSALSVKGVSIGDVTMNYKGTTTLRPQITADSGVKYTVRYESFNPKVATVDDNGNVYAAKKGTAEIKVTVTDENGNTVTDTCKVTVKYSGLQWFIIIVLFGWIWYVK